MSAMRRGAFDGCTGYGSRTLSKPGPTNTSASPSFAQQMPAAPRSSCHFAMIGDLCVFACGRSCIPAADASRCTRSMLAMSRRRSIKTCGVGSSASRTPMIVALREKAGEPRRRHSVAGKDRTGVSDAEVPDDDFGEHVAEVGGHRKVASVVAPLDVEAGPRAVHAAAADTAADDEHR